MLTTDMHRIAADPPPMATNKAISLPSAAHSDAELPERIAAIPDAQTQRKQRNRLLVAATLFVYLALLVVWQIDTLQSGPFEPWDVLTLGVILGAMTGVGFVVRHCWRFYLASRR